VSQRPNTKSTSGILSVGAVGAAGPHVVLEPEGASSSGGLGPQISRTPNRHSNTSAGCIFSAGAVGAAGPHVVLKPGGFEPWGLAP